jgi:serine/threonine protein kinase/outer membrane protein assembly factor BamB
MHTPDQQRTQAEGHEPEQAQSSAPVESGLSDLARLLDQCLAELQAGRKPDRAKLLAEHPSLAPQLEQALDGLEFIHRASADAAPAPAQLGDFRVVREVGRGGMGVVYEAEQISLKRRVALKVLRFGAVADEVAMQRFQREAETVAQLHHTNIVPIFAVGCEHGARYYAMQFIEGRNLAERAQEGRAPASRLAPRDVADWGRQAAEALAHAHQRGVIHRDIKPSNLILDRDGRIWLTDFGLARRMDDVALSVAGALLGTPRYMSPEQARASRHPIDHRTDVYSLGATLYELATGQPIFAATSAHEVLAQILNDEPRAPRQFTPELPRDFETIILKCLAKEPTLRYATAQALADDLRAFLEGRAISARPPSVPERVVRWARKHRRTTTVAAFSAAVSLVLAVGGYLFWQDRQQARLGRLELATDSPNLLGEVVDADGRALSPVFPVPTPEPVVLPAGAHQLRLSASGLLSETWPIEITRRQSQTHFVQLNPRWLWPPGEVNTAEHPETEIVMLRNHADLLVTAYTATDQSAASNLRRLRLLDGATGKSVWPRDLIFDETTLPAGGSVEAWRALLNPTGLASNWRDAGLADRVRDLDGDGVGDPVLLSRTSPSLLAVSGATGRVLWWARTRPTFDAVTNQAKLDGSGRGFVVGLPAVGEVDGDGTPDFVACFHSDGDTYVAPKQSRLHTGAQDWLGAISGKTGAVLWQSRVTEDWRQYLDSSTGAEKFHPLCRPAFAQVNGRSVIVLVEKATLRGFDARTGEAAWAPLALGFEPDHAPDLADLDGDGQSEALFLRVREDAGAQEATKSGFSEEASLSLLAVSLADGAVRWERPFVLAPKWQAHELKNRRRQFHQLADLDGDGRPEVILAGGERNLRGGTRLTFDVVDSRTGSNRWHRLVWAQDYFGGLWNVDQFLVGPDLDGDGQRELFAAWEGWDAASLKQGLHVVALSGANGAMLWRSHQPGAGAPSSLAWWHAGAGGWPLLMVSSGRAGVGKAHTLVFATGSGRLEHTLPDVPAPRVADFDGDGILDLFYTVSPQGAPRNLVVKGTAPDAWRQLGDWRGAADFDGDGFTDLVGISEGVLAARSGNDGRRLWHAKKAPRDSAMESPEPTGDCDGDGVPDVLATVNVWREVRPNAFTSKRLPAAFSGRDGRQLWTGDELDIFAGSSSGGGPNWSFAYPLLDWADLDRDGRAELLAVQAQAGGALQLSVASGTDGRVRWTTPITRGGLAPTPSPSGRPLADFNGDQLLDLALWVPTKPGESEWGPLQLNVLDGRSGQRLWPTSSVTVHHPERLVWPEPAVADLDGDGVPEVLATRHGGYDGRSGQYQCELLAVDGRDGKVRWKWTWQTGFPQLWPPLVLPRSPVGPAWVCVVVQTNNFSTLVALDANGYERLRRTLRLSWQQFDSGRFIWRAAAVDGDGREELLFLDNGELCVASSDTLTVRWRWALPHDTARVVDVRAGTPGAPPVLTVWAGQEVFGLDGASGEPLWRCRVSGSPQSGSSEAPVVRRFATPAPELARVQLVPSSRASGSASSAVRQAWPVNESGQYRTPRPAPHAFPPLPEVVVPQRRLPWAQSDTALIFAGGVALLLAGLPAALVGWAIRRRSWLLGLLPLCYAGIGLLLPWRALIPAVIMVGYAMWLGIAAGRSRRWWVLAVAGVYAGLALAVGLGSVAPATMPGDPVWLRGLPMAAAGVPGLAFWAMCGWAVARRRWRLLAWLTGASLAAALGVAAAMLWRDHQEIARDETYSWQGAYLVWFVGVAIAGLGGSLVVGVRWLAAWFRRRRGQQPAVATPA